MFYSLNKISVYFTLVKFATCKTYSYTFEFITIVSQPFYENDRMNLG